MGFISAIELNVFRFGCAVFLCILALAFEQKLPTIDKNQLPGIVVTGLGIVVYRYTLYTGAELLPAGTLHGFYNGAMIIVCTLVTVVTPRSCPLSASIPCLLCICGLVMTSQPPLLGFPSVTRTQVHNISFCYNTPVSLDTTDAEEGNQGNTSYSSININASGEQTFSPWYYLYPAIGGTGAAITIMVSKTYLSDIDPFISSLWKGMIGLIVSIIVMVIVEKPVLPQLPACWGLCAGHILCGGAAAVFLGIAVIKIPPVSMSYISALDTVPTGFEPTRGDPNGLAVHRLNHSATSSALA